MASTSEKTYGSRLANAQKLATHLAGFTSYTPVTPDCGLPAYQSLIEDITTTNATLATSLATFTFNADARQQLFKTSDTSMLKRLTPISAYIKALFGKNSKEAETIGALVKKLRGVQTDKFKKDETGEWVSQSQRSYGSMAQNFANLIDTLVSIGDAYNPTMTNIQLPQLQSLHDDLITSTDKVTQSYGKLKTEQDLRVSKYNDLSSRTTRIKDTIKSQYGISSSEYKLIKGLKI